MRIGCLQFAPQVGDVDNNLNRADAVLNKAADVEDLDLLVLPELAFSGYNFRSLAEISPYLEPSGSGISALWARTTALKFNCNVVVGYPEKVDVAQKWPTSPEFYNSAIIINSDGETIANYRKSFLYAIDETWALEGQDGFFEGYIDGMGDVAMGICMDLNPYRFEAPWHDFEFAYHILDVKANLVILTMSWLTREGAHSFSQLPQEPDLQTLEYWVQRLEPVVRNESDEEIIVVFCNRCGTEGDAVYAGTSAVLGVKNGDVNLYGILGRGVKELLVVDTDKAPFAKLLCTDQERKSATTKSEGYSSNQSIAGSSSPNVSQKPTPITAKRPFFPFRDMGLAEGHDVDSIATPIEDIDDAWEITSTAASVGSAPSSYSRSGPTQSSRVAVPKLELQIPATTETRRSSQPKRPASATRPRSAKPGVPDEEDIPTPTAPTPTPMSVRPYFDVADKIPTVSMRSHIDLPDRKPATQSKKEPLPALNTKDGVSSVKVKRADTPITPPWRAGTKEKARSTTPIAEAPPSPPSDGDEAKSAEKSTTKTTKAAKESPPVGKKSPKLSVDTPKVSSKPKEKENQGRSSARYTPRLTTSSLSAIRPGLSKSYTLASATSGLNTATPISTSLVLDAIWDDALQTLKSGGIDITGDTLNRHEDQDDLLVGDTSSQAEVQERLFSDVQQKFAHLAQKNEKPSSPAPAALPERPPSTKSRNVSLPRNAQGFNSPDLRRSMSQSRMSIPIMASPSVFRQEFQPMSQAQHSDSPIYFRPESKSSTKPGLSHSRQTSEVGKQGSSPPAPNPPAKSGDTPPGGASGSVDLGNQIQRPVSRGRQPFSKANPTNGTPTHSTQRSNVNNGRVALSAERGRQGSAIRAAEPAPNPSRSAAPSALSSRNRSMSTSSSATWLFGTPPPTRTHPPLQPGDEIIAMINLIHNDCPVHNSRAPSQGPQTQTPGTEPRSQSQSQAQRQGRQPSQQREQQTPQRQGTPRAQTPSLRLQAQSPSPQQQQQQQQLQQQQQSDQPPRSQTPASQGSNEEPLYEVILPPHIRELVDSLSSPDSRVQSPLRALDLLKPDRSTPKFDPPTPTAMQFAIDEKKQPASA